MYEAAAAAAAALLTPLAKAGFQVDEASGLTVIVETEGQGPNEAEAGLFRSEEDGIAAADDPEVLAVEVRGRADVRYMVV